MKVLTIKDEEGVLRPSALCYAADNERLVKAIRDEWEANTSKKKEFRDCTLVEAELTEIKL
jgi:hypothetical protein